MPGTIYHYKGNLPTYQRQTAAQERLFPSNAYRTFNSAPQNGLMKAEDDSQAIAVDLLAHNLPQLQGPLLKSTDT
jgi:hypothetical protein